MSEQNYHGRMMNILTDSVIRTASGSGAYLAGHRDARHAAAEIAGEADAELAHLRAEVDALTDSNGRKADRIDRLGETVERLRAELDTVRNDFNALQTALVGNTGASAILTASSLRAELSQANATIAELRGAVSAALSALRAEVLEMKDDPKKGDMVFRCGINGACDVVTLKIDRMLAAAPQPQPAGDQADRDEVDAAQMDIFKAYRDWPSDIRKKLSMHDLRRMRGWAARPTGSWALDHSAGTPILVYDGCCVIEDDHARYVLSLIAADAAKGEGRG